MITATITAWLITILVALTIPEKEPKKVYNIDNVDEFMESQPNF